MYRSIAALVLAVSMCSALHAADWPAWRGPTGQGFCDETNVPLKWSNKQNVKWKIKLAHQGNSTPVVWGDKIFLTQANKGGSERSLLCFARADGALLWHKTVHYADREQNWNESWYANASPALDAERVVVCFASAGLHCYDHQGSELWHRTDLGKWQDPFGNGASPVIYDDLVIQWCGPNRGKGRNFLLAVNKTTGKTVWEHDEKFGSWSTPLIAKVNGQDQLLVGQSLNVKSQPEEKWGHLKGFDPKSGKELWRCRGLSSFVYASPLYGNGVAVQMCGYYGSAMAVRLGGSGDITNDRLWLHAKKNDQRVGSGVIVGDHVYMMDEKGMVHCFDVKTGRDLWEDVPRPGTGSTWGSMVHADGRLYVLMRNGETLVFAAKPKFELLATNSLGGGEQTNSSLAISNGDIFIRTFKHLWCIANGADQAEAPKSEAPKSGAPKLVALKDGDHIIFFGDSLTQLAGQEAPKQHVKKGYVRIVAETLAEKHKDKKIKVDWVATGGHTVPDLLKRVDRDVIAKKPTIVVIQIGCNDARRIPQATFKSGLEELIGRLQQADIQVIQCSLTTVSERHDGKDKNDPKLEAFAQVARDVAKANNVPLNDLRKAFMEYLKVHNPDNKHSGFLTYDGNHWNDNGMRFVAQQMLKMLK